MILGLAVIIWVVLIVYFVGMLVMGWWCRRSADSQEGYLMGHRRFGLWLMIMHAFGAGTNPSDAAGVVSKTVSAGASGIWVSWMWLFGTPFYWLIAPVIRRLRCLTMADYFQERFGKAASALYIVVASIGMTVCLASVLLATTRTVQGMMGKASGPDAEAWFFGILLVTTITFTVYGYWGGIVAAVRTDMIQGIMIIVLSFLAIPAALKLETVMGLDGMRTTLNTLAGQREAGILRLFDPGAFRLGAVILLCINAPLTALALPHLVSVCGAGKTEWEGRMGITCGNMLKRVCTIGWCLLALCWLAHLTNTSAMANPDAAFGDLIRALLSPFLQGLMLACIMAAAMSSGDAFQITVAGLFSQNIYKVYVNPEASDEKVLRVTKWTGIAIVVVSLGFAVLTRSSVVKAILDYFNILGLVGISVAMGLLWRRMNTTGVFCSTLSAAAVFLISRYVMQWPRECTVGLPILTGIVFGIVGSLLTAPPDPETVARFFTKIYTPIGAEDQLDKSLDEAVPAEQRLFTAGGLFVVKPSRQSVIGFLLTVAACVACIAVMAILL